MLLGTLAAALFHSHNASDGPASLLHPLKVFLAMKEGVNLLRRQQILGGESQDLLA